ncbi:hypothetical protein DMENIID0001_039510 [Sergentomyia squamirostris]
MAKIVIIVVIAFVSVVLATSIKHRPTKLPCIPDNGCGRPGCETDEEMQCGVWCNNWNSHTYWKCEKRGVPATLVKCPKGTGFMTSVGACVPRCDWKWEPACRPPTSVPCEVPTTTKPPCSSSTSGHGVESGSDSNESPELVVDPVYNSTDY